MDETDKAPEEQPKAEAKPADAPTAEQKPVDAPTVEARPEEKPPTSATPPAPPKPEGGKKHDWTHIALIVLSIVVVLLLASTVAMAVTGGHGCRRGHQQFEKGFRMNRGPMMRGYGRQWNQNPNNNQNQQGQPQQSQPTAPSQPQQVPIPGQ
jgi:hypothetical protein